MVTVAEQVAVFPELSVTVNVTRFAPISEQSKEVGEMLVSTVPQASELPLLTWLAVMVAVPEALRLTVIFWQEAVGGVTSFTVTVEVQVEVFPCESVTVNVTVLVPIFAQLKVVGEIDNEEIPQASVLLLLICTALMVTLPAPLSDTVRFWHVATGAMLS